jgi:hypothetical protein
MGPRFPPGFQFPGFPQGKPGPGHEPMTSHGQFDENMRRFAPGQLPHGVMSVSQSGGPPRNASQAPSTASTPSPVTSIKQEPTGT